MSHSTNPSGHPVVMISGYRGLAENFIRTFEANHFKVSVLVRNPTAIAELKKRFPSVLFVPGEISTALACKNWIEKTIQTFGQIDALINNAAISGPAGRTGEMPFSEIEETIQINLLAPLRLFQLALPYLKKSKIGTTVNLSGGGATNPRPLFSSYGISKTALVRATENLALEYPELRFYAVAPGSLKTPMIEKIANLEPSGLGAEHAEATRRMKEGGDDPQRAADLVLWLCTERPRALSGKVISAIWDKYKSPPDAPPQEVIWTLRRVDEVLLKVLSSFSGKSP